MMSRAIALVVSFCGLPYCEGACSGERNGTCVREEPLEDVGLLQAKRFRAHEHRGGQHRATCRVGQGVHCPGSRVYCAGRQCCPGHPSFPCPSAPPGWSQCGTSQKRENCVTDGPAPSPPSPSPSPSPPSPPSPVPRPPPAADGYHPHFDTTPDYLGIAAHAAGVKGNSGSRSDNYYLVIADSGGCAGGCGSCCATQRRVAEKMREFVANRKRRSPHSKLLFVLVGGDNFYWNGASPGRFQRTWLDVYGSELTSVPWFAVLGNHDYGNNDPTVGCPDVRPRFTCDDSNAHTPACGGPRPYSTQPQGYNSNALNADKGGVDGALRRNWHQPDYTYYYSIPELDFELLALDWNVEQFGAMGGNGFCNTCGAHSLVQHCGGRHNLYEAMTKVKEASTELLNNRSAAAESRNIAIISHYPDGFQRGINLRQEYLKGMPAEKRDGAKVFNFYGHTHVQHCDKTSASGECTDFMTGAAGGCCGWGALPAGFVAISWNDDNEQVVECFVGQECTLHRYSVLPPHHGRSSPGDDVQEVCAHTADDPRCTNRTRSDI